MKMQPDFDKAHEIYFRLGIIYKQQQKYNESLEVSREAWSRKRPQVTDPTPAVFQVHRELAADAAHGRGYLVSDWPRS